MQKGRLTLGVLELILAYITASLAIDTGSLLQYGVTIALVIGGVINLVEAAKISGKHHGKRAVKKH